MKYMFKQLNTAHIAKNSASFCNFIYFRNDLLPSFSCFCVYSEEVDDIWFASELEMAPLHLIKNKRFQVASRVTSRCAHPHIQTHTQHIAMTQNTYETDMF